MWVRNLEFSIPPVMQTTFDSPQNQIYPIKRRTCVCLLKSLPSWERNVMA